MSASPTIAVILAGGVGTRVGLGMPKQLIRIAGKAIVEHTLEALDEHPGIDEILVMMNAATVSELDYLKDPERFPKLRAILPGGDTRNETTQLALAALGDDADVKVLFHDAVRPFVDERIITECIEALDVFDAVDTAIPSADTIIEIDEHNVITGIPARSKLRRGQTPQGFRLSTIRRAYELAEGDPEFAATDDCGVVFTYLPDVPIKVVLGTPENMKVTEPLDIHIADKIFQLQSAALSTGHLDQLDLTGRSIVVFGGSYGIGASIAEQARTAGARVHSYSRSGTGTDVTSRKKIRAALADAASHGPIDYVVLTAGVLAISHLVSTSKRRLRDTVDVNLIAPAKVAQESFPYLAETNGQLLFFTSSSYTRGRAGYSLYSATKAGVVNLTQALADEWAEAGVRVNCLNPQRTKTPMRTAAFGEEPPESLLDPEAVALTSLRVLDADMTGQIVDVRVTGPKA
ncbi:bifunctional cytidylyltransferase/SDR family oxidoreductase [Agromyces sp. Leaf222]|uniref:bifunctional cytidylyltransferase/SDR family oxidoreductase n=1 Tax=Agromyces sp. Leaf222 TaxID=1735688 RepID=UPI0006FC37ED|nr:bifunctional cytidylyltransferase/SDR family oxidoreductase [Agromyces sp. Leaf222]KQM84132.1 2-C-methyl-D-erythritol 4-phosphate cytidylyltransferase [Agromyces sp. Leaf222]